MGNVFKEIAACLQNYWFIWNIIGSCGILAAASIVNFILRVFRKSKLKLNCSLLILIYLWSSSCLFMMTAGIGEFSILSRKVFSCPDIEYGAFFYTHLLSLVFIFYRITFSAIKIRWQLLLAVISCFPLAAEILTIQYEMKCPAGELVFSFFRIEAFALLAWGVGYACKHIMSAVFHKTVTVLKSNQDKKNLVFICRAFPWILGIAICLSFTVSLLPWSEALADYNRYGRYYGEVIRLNKNAAEMKYWIFLSNPFALKEELNMWKHREDISGKRDSPIMSCPNCSGTSTIGSSEAFYQQLNDETAIFLHLTISGKRTLCEFDGLKVNSIKSGIKASRTWLSQKHICDPDFLFGREPYAAVYSTDEHYISLLNFYKLDRDNDVYHAAVIMTVDPDIHSASTLFKVYLAVWKNRSPYAWHELYQSESSLHSDVVSHLADNGMMHLNLKPVNKWKTINIFDRTL